MYDCVVSACRFVGPGPLAFFRFDVIGIGRIHLFQASGLCPAALGKTPRASPPSFWQNVQAMTPLGSPMRQAVSFSWYAPPRVSSMAVKYVVLNWVRNFEQDIRVWENKVCVDASATHQICVSRPGHWCTRV